MTSDSGGDERGLGGGRGKLQLGHLHVHSCTVKTYTTGPVYQMIIGFNYPVTLNEQFPRRPTSPNHVNHTFDYCVAIVVVLVV